MLINLLYIVIAILLLCFIILFHELGHYIAGRLCGIGIVEFAIGFGPKIAHWERKGIQYSIRALPLGGFCQFVGEDEANAAPNAMNRQPVWKRLITVLAGPAMNLVLAFLAGTRTSRVSPLLLMAITASLSVQREELIVPRFESWV